MPTMSSLPEESHIKNVPGISAGTRPHPCDPHTSWTTSLRSQSGSINGSNEATHDAGSSPNAFNSGEGSTVATIKGVVQGFLDQLSYRSPQTPQNADMRREIAAEIASWNDDLSPSFIKGLTDTSCTIAETAYKHTSSEHQFIVALYTAYLTYADDIGQHNLEAVGGFVQRFTQGQTQSMVAFDRLTTLLGTLHGYYARISADAIVTNSLDSLTGMYIELVTKGDRVHPAADRYPFYLRLKTGIASAYAHLNFTKNWGDATGHFYLQLLPEFELVIVGINDILSFYKEALAGETDNYVHMRAAAEQKPPLMVLQELADENLESIRKIEELATCQAGLAEICRSFIMGYIEFHFNARRYRLEETVDVTRYTSA